MVERGISLVTDPQLTAHRLLPQPYLATSLMRFPLHFPPLTEAGSAASHRGHCQASSRAAHRGAQGCWPFGVLLPELPGRAQTRLLCSFRPHSAQPRVLQPLLSTYYMPGPWQGAGVPVPLEFPV